MALVRLTILVCLFLSCTRAFADDVSKCEDFQIDACTKLIESGGYSKEDLAQVYNKRGWARYQKEEYDLAISDFNRAIRLNIKFALAYSNRGMAYEWKSRLNFTSTGYGLAFADYDKAVRLDPKFSLAYQNRARIHSQQLRYQKAIADYSSAIAIERDAGLFFARGDVYFETKDYKKAIADFAEAIALDPKDPFAYFWRGVSHEKLGHTRDAIRDYKMALGLRPGNKKILASLKRLGATPEALDQ